MIAKLHNGKFKRNADLKAIYYVDYFDEPHIEAIEELTKLSLERYAKKMINEDHNEQTDQFTELLDIPYFCESCDGEGKVWEQAQCGMSMSNCCGGCGKDVECEECNGKGINKIYQ